LPNNPDIQSLGTEVWGLAKLSDTFWNAFFVAVTSKIAGMGLVTHTKQPDRFSFYSGRRGKQAAESLERRCSEKGTCSKDVTQLLAIPEEALVSRMIVNLLFIRDNSAGRVIC
jgi:hypothetical protein